MISVVIICKDETSLDDTLAIVADQVTGLDEPSEVLVVDASAGRLDHIRQRHAAHVRWIDFQPPSDVSISIPHQRNRGSSRGRWRHHCLYRRGLPAGRWVA